MLKDKRILIENRKQNIPVGRPVKATAKGVSGGRGRGQGRGRGRGRGRGQGKMIEEGPHDWEAPDWRMQCNSISGLADSCPMNYKEIKELKQMIEFTFHQMKWQCCCQMLHWTVMKSMQ